MQAEPLATWHRRPTRRCRRTISSVAPLSRPLAAERQGRWADEMKKQPKRKERPGVDRLGRTALHDAALAGDVRKVAELVARGLSADAADDNGWTPLHFAAQSWSHGSCLALLEAG